MSNKKIAIIGSGPAGLTAGIYAARADLDTTIYTGMQPGGQLTTTTEIENFPGAWDKQTKTGMMGPDLMNLIQLQAESFGAKVKLEEVSDIQKLDTKFLVNATTSDEYDAVIIASGASAKYLNIPGEEKYVGKGYHSCATCDGFFYKNKSIAVVGGGDSAMEEANFLTKFASKVYLIHRRDSFRASKIMQERLLNNPKVEVLYNKAIAELVGQIKLESVILEDTQTKEKSSLTLDGVFVAIGHTPNSKFAKQLLSMDEAGYLTPASSHLSKIMQEGPDSDFTKLALTFPSMSEIEGIFIAGDVEDKKYRQAITAAAGGCKAAMDCEKWLEQGLV